MKVHTGLVARDLRIAATLEALLTLPAFGRERGQYLDRDRVHAPH